MPTMSSYELKVSGMLDNVDPVKVAQAITDFRAIMDYDWSTWTKEFALSQRLTYTLKWDATVDDPIWPISAGSALAAGSVLKKGSKLNSQPVDPDQTLGVKTPVIDNTGTVLVQGSILKAGSEIAPEPYQKLVWDVRPEVVPKWTLVNGTAEPTGTYVRLSLHGVVASVRGGALGEHWGKQTAQWDLEWFYRYRHQGWFKELIKALILFNERWKNLAILAEAVRVRDVKWYCGNGAGP